MAVKPNEKGSYLMFDLSDAKADIEPCSDGELFKAQS